MDSQNHPKACLSFTGGKDCMLALHIVSGLVSLPPEETTEPPLRLDVALLVVFAPENAAFKAHPMHVMKAQAEALGLPLHVCTVRAPHLESYTANIEDLRRQHGITHLVTGDILDVCHNFMGRAAAAAGVTLHRPLWQVERHVLLDALWSAGIVARITCINLARFAAAPPPAPAAAASQQQPQDGTCGGPQLPGAPDADGAAARPGGGADADSGWDPERDVLGAVIDAPLCSPQGALGRAHAQRRVDLCGEGGETHSCVLSCPLYRGRRVALGGVDRGREGDYAWLVVGSATLEEDAP